jgi:hypothetical protein
VRNVQLSRKILYRAGVLVLVNTGHRNIGSASDNRTGLPDCRTGCSVAPLLRVSNIFSRGRWELNTGIKGN